MKKLLPILLACAATGVHAATPEQNATCVENPALESLAPNDRNAVSEALRLHSDGMCATDACEFRLHRLSNDRTLISLRAVRYSDEVGRCFTVYMGRTGIIVDPSGRISDAWPYCLVAAEEARHDPAIKDELGYHWCEE